MPIYGIKGIDARIGKLQKALMRTIPERIGQDAENHFRSSFKQGGYTDRGFVKWPARKKQPVNKRGTPVKHTVLFRTGILRNSVRLLPGASWNRIQVVAGGPHAPYARIHNEGGTITSTANVRAHTRREHMARTKAGVRMRKEAKVRASIRRMNTTIPKRQYMGESKVLEATMRATILKSVAEAMKPQSK